MCGGVCGLSRSCMGHGTILINDALVSLFPSHSHFSFCFGVLKYKHIASVRNAIFSTEFGNTNSTTTGKRTWYGFHPGLNVFFFFFWGGGGD